ncbi:MAG: hypothetical protein M3016_02820 [Actinomycetota bacterium]|nr:hypothetical protein [Actinomycetota bacterium]
MVRSRSALLGLAALLVAGCGGGAAPAHQGASAAGPRARPQILRTIPHPGPTGTQASAQSVAVIRGWSSALRAGRVQVAARYFSLPSELINGVGVGGSVAVIRIHSLGQAEAANATLPCGAQFISADQRGRYVNALFRLTGRPGPGGSQCGGGTGQTARTNFVISGGRIVEWIRAPDDPGDNGSPKPPPGSGSGAPVV